MQKQKTSYKIYTTKAMDKELLQNWKIPKFDEQNPIGKEQLMTSIYTEIEKQNYTEAIKILMEYFKSSNIESPKELYDLALSLNSQQTSNSHHYTEEYQEILIKKTCMSLIEKLADKDDFKDEQKSHRF